MLFKSILVSFETWNAIVSSFTDDAHPERNNMHTNVKGIFGEVVIVGLHPRLRAALVVSDAPLEGYCQHPLSGRPV